MVEEGEGEVDKVARRGLRGREPGRKEDVGGDPVSVAEFLAPSNRDDHKGSSLPLRLKLLPPYLGDAASLLQPFLIHTLTSTAAAALSLLP